MNNKQELLSRLIICIPTYKRKWPVILSLIEANPELDFYFCVRKEEFDKGFYDEVQFLKDNIYFMTLENVTCIGETREAILQQCIEWRYKYCLMIDDTQYCIHDASNRIEAFDTILLNCLRRFENDPFSDRAFAFTFSRKAYSTTRGTKDRYFVSQLCQTYILNLDLIKKHDLHFERMDVVGIEDLMFYFKAACKGLVALSDTRFLRVGLMPSVKKKGGCHVGNENRNEYQVQLERMALMTSYIDSLPDDEYDKKYIVKIDMTSIPGRYYYKFDSDYAEKKLLKEYKILKDICTFD